MKYGPLLIVPFTLLLTLAACTSSQSSPTTTTTPEVESRTPSYVQGLFVVVDDPLVITASDSMLADDELVLGYAQDDVARAYPVSMLQFHAIVNDTVHGTPLLITY